MILVKELFKEKPFPKWFSSHPLFKETEKITKVFPGIGLPNCTNEIEVDNTKIADASARRVLSDIQYYLTDRTQALKYYAADHPNISAERKAKLDKCITLLSEVSAQIAKSKKACIRINNGRITLGLPKDITLKDEERPILRSGEGLFRVYNKLNELLRDGRFNAMTKLEDIETFKEFSTENVPNDRFKIVFSADGNDGAWDIATMSMRGVSSCQSWNGDYHHCLIGSVTDPFVGIIYLTSGSKFNEHGSKMMRRCIVRFVINEKTKKPMLLLDNMYPSNDNKVLKQFKDFLKEKTTLDVHYAPTMNQKTLGSTYQPLTPFRDKLRKFDRTGKTSTNGFHDLESIASYQDCHIQSKVGNTKDQQAAWYAKNSKKKGRRFVKAFGEALKNALNDVKLNELPSTTKTTIKKLKGQKGNGNWNYTYLLPDLSKKIAEEFVNSVDRNSFLNSDTYARRVYYNYFNNKEKICNNIKTKFVKELNGSIGNKPKERIKGKDFIAMMKVIFPKMDGLMKEKLKEIIEKQKKPTGPLPLP